MCVCVCVCVWCVYSKGCHGQWLCNISLQTPEEASPGSRSLLLHTAGKHDHLFLLQECGKYNSDRKLSVKVTVNVKMFSISGAQIWELFFLLFVLFSLWNIYQDRYTVHVWCILSFFILKWRWENKATVGFFLLCFGLFFFFPWHKLKEN